MKVVVTAKRALLDDRLGRLAKGRVLEMPDDRAQWYLSRGEVTRYETKVAHENPSKGAGLTELSSASPVAQASQQTTWIESGPGVKKRGRPRKAAP